MGQIEDRPAAALLPPDRAYYRVRLAAMLCEAAELEHGLCCQYLFAAFSMKREMSEGLTAQQVDMVRDWRTQLMLVARQEMEHLGYVNNILTALGEAPHLVRPDFPLDPLYYETNVESKLERFTLDTMKRFVLFELPQGVEHQPETMERLRKVYGPDFDPRKYQTLGQLYGAVWKLLEVCENDAKARGGTIFIGPRSAEFQTGDDNISGFRPGVDSGKIYDMWLKPVYDLESAQDAVMQILEEGEGAPEHIEGSHFDRFLKVVEALMDGTKCPPGFDAARPIVDNPRTDIGFRGVGQKHGTLITEPMTNVVSRAFDLAYTTMMLMLIRFFDSTDEGDDDRRALEQAVFFPFMTVVIRPLGELLTELPATSTGGNAGPSFRFDRRVGLLPHRDAAFEIIHMNLTTLAGALEDLPRRFAGKPKLGDRLAFVYQNVWRIADDFARRTATGEYK